MQIKIFRGTHQIGGVVTEIKTNNARIIIDMGESLPSSNETEVLFIDGVTQGRPSCNAVLVTHYHGDHVGMYERVLPEIPIFMGAVAKQIYFTIQQTLKNKIGTGNPERVQTFETYDIGKPLFFGDIKVTPYTVDHSAFDAYMLLIEAEGKRILHTGDFRMHGAKGRKMPDVFEKYCKDIDVLICEGTMLSRTNEQVLTEHDLGTKAMELLLQNKYVFVLCSSSNIDTIAEFYNAALKNNRPFVVCEKDFQAQILDIVTQNTTSQFYNFNRRKIYSFDKNLIPFMSERGFLFLGRTNLATKKALEIFPDSLLVYSMWNGYLDKTHPAFDEYKYNFVQTALQNGCRLVKLHTSGHADATEIRRLCEITQAKIVIPIHSENPEAMQRYIDNKVLLLQDNEAFTL